MEKKSRHTLVDLFAGCGGLSLGLEHAGFETVFFNENVPNYAATYIANRELSEENYYVGDINNLIENVNDYSSVLLNSESSVSLVSGGLLSHVDLFSYNNHSGGTEERSLPIRSKMPPPPPPSQD